MKTLALALLAAAAACQVAPAEKPARALDPQDPKSLAEHAAYNTRTQSSYRTKFSARIAAPQGDPIDYKGASVWVSPGVLYIHYTASGGDLKNIVRAETAKGQPNVWVHHEAAGWVTAEEIGSPGLGKGIQNPDEVLAVLGRHLGAARLLRSGVVEIAFAGEDIEKIMKEQAQRGAFDWKQSTATVELHVDAQTRLAKFTCEASLRSTDPNVKGAVRYSATVEVESYNAETEMKFLDEKKKEIPLDPEIRKAIETAKKEKK